MRTKRARAAVGAAAVLVGLLSSPAPQVAAGDDGGPYFDLAALPAPDLTGKQMFDGLKRFVNDYPLRITGTPNEIRAGLALHEEMASLGYQAQTCSLASGQSHCLSGDASRLGGGLRVVMGTKRGTTRPDEWIMFIGHYDTIASTVYGAYDNGAGTSFIRYLAHEFKDVQTNRSLVFALYNGEEEGLLASAAHAQALKAAGQKIHAVLGFDMVGIAWPVKQETSRSCLCMFHGAADKERFDPLLRHVNYEFLKFPNHANKVTIRGTNTRNSDERSFANQGYPTMRWAGMKTAANYVAYHLPNDTIETIISEAGGEEYFEQGTENTLKSVYYTALALDNHLPVPAATLGTDGLRLTADATGSTDKDAPPSAFSWSFGDGTTAQGATVEHTYAAPGTYEVTLTVTDNLWSQVSRSATYTVTVA